MSNFIDGEVCNRDRADWAYAAIKAFAECTGQDNSGDLDADIEAVVADLLCDLQHFCAFERISFDQASERAYSHFKAEFSVGDLIVSDTLEGT